MSNILPKKSWHVYNEENRLKVKKDESAAKIEKDKAEERSKAAEREHRLSILRKKTNPNSSDLNYLNYSIPKIKETNTNSNPNIIPVHSDVHLHNERFELFKPEDETNSRKISSQSKSKEKFSTMNYRKIREKCIENEHWREDPIHKYANEKEKYERKIIKPYKVLKHKSEPLIECLKNKQRASEDILNKQRLLSERLRREERERQREDELLLLLFNSSKK